MLKGGGGGGGGGALEGRVAEWLEALTCNPEVPGSSLLSDHWLDLSTVVPDANPRPRL